MIDQRMRVIVDKQLASPRTTTAKPIALGTGFFKHNKKVALTVLWLPSCKTDQTPSASPGCHGRMVTSAVDAISMGVRKDASGPQFCLRDKY
ncbi:hypothetical protein ElyMa_002836400 [Elysia marginata]|uniref:Uncharacterized protein n=1 Tax=Elysia marginata TaxID=1093978 RepID=A0AAV4HU40_9GAST|nr:hypothetical protein ElyMa_002836400 [Elysia marginata]